MGYSKRAMLENAGTKERCQRARFQSLGRRRIFWGGIWKRLKGLVGSEAIADEEHKALRRSLGASIADHTKWPHAMDNWALEVNIEH